MIEIIIEMLAVPEQQWHCWVCSRVVAAGSCNVPCCRWQDGWGGWVSWLRHRGKGCESLQAHAGDAHPAAAQGLALSKLGAGTKHWITSWDTYCSKKLQIQGCVPSLLFSGPVERSLGRPQGPLFCWPKLQQLYFASRSDQMLGFAAQRCLNVLWENKRQGLNPVPLSSGWWHETSVQSEWGPLCTGAGKLPHVQLMELCSSSVLAEYNKLLHHVSSSSQRWSFHRIVMFQELCHRKWLMFPNDPILMQDLQEDL